MKDNSLSKLGGICAVLTGISIAVAGFAYILEPIEQQTWKDPGAYLSSFAQNPTFAAIEYWANALGAVFALAMVLAISEKVRPVNEGWARWASTLALIGYAVIAVQYFRELALIPGRAAAYVTSDGWTRAAIAANQYLVLLDPYGWITFGAVGSWLLVVNMLALRGKSWAKPLAYVGIVGATAYWLVVAGTSLHVDILVTIAAAAGVIVGPIWSIWAGLILLRENHSRRPLASANTYS